MTYVLPFDLYDDWKELMFATEVSKNIVEELKEHIKCGETKIVLIEKNVAEALRKQIPEKPHFEGDGYDDSGELIYDTWICPNCGDRYGLDYEIHQYCPMCGQRIDWDAAKGE